MRIGQGVRTLRISHRGTPPSLSAPFCRKRVGPAGRGARRRQWTFVNPWISVRVADPAGQPIGTETLLGRCVQLLPGNYERGFKRRRRGATRPVFFGAFLGRPTRTKK